jgi:SAM-dependent methyltransferase
MESTMKARMARGDLDLVRRVNELYHDLQVGQFNEIHKYRHAVECKFWQANVAAKLKRDRAAFGVDLCTGTGFVPRILLETLPAVNMLCVDLSRNALESSARSLGAHAARATFHAGDVCSLPLSDAVADWVSMNAALHHIPGPEGVFREIDRVLKPGGRFCLGYEPNSAFFNSAAVLRAERLIWHACWYLSVRRNASRILRRLGFRRMTGDDDQHLDVINRTLLAEGARSEALSLDELRALVDVHADSGPHHDHTRGFSVPEMLDRHFQKYDLETLVFSDYGGEMLRRHACLRLLYDSLMRRMAPGKGQLFSLVLRKRGRAKPK